MFLYNSKKIKINLEYNTNITNIEVETFQTVRHLKDKILKLYHPMNFQPRLIYSNKDISEDENLIIGDLFKNQNSVDVKIIQPMQIGQKNKINTNREKDISNILSSTKYPKQLSNNSLMKGKEKLYQSTIVSDTKIMSIEFTNNNFSCYCGATIFNYCFSCGEFLCNLCKLKHSTHKSFQVDPENIEESIKLYSISLQAGLSHHLSKVREYDKHFKNYLLIDPESRKEMIMRKLDELDTICKQNFNKDNLSPYQTNCNSIEKSTNLINKEIEKIVEELTFSILNKKKNLSPDQAKEFFDNIHQKEKRMEEVKSEVDFVCNYFKFAKKIDSMYNDIDKIINSLINEINPIPKPHSLSSNRNYNNASVNKENFFKTPEHNNQRVMLIKNKDRINIEEVDNYFTRNNEENFKGKLSRRKISEMDVKPETGSAFLINNLYSLNTPQPRRPVNSKKNSLFASPFDNNNTGINLNININSPIITKTKNIVSNKREKKF